MTFPLPEKLTVWNEQGNDGLGGVTWDGPYVYDGRIAYKQEKFTDDNGDERMSTAVCYSEGAELKIGSMVEFSESAAISPPTSANDVRALSRTPSGPGDMKKAWFS